MCTVCVDKMKATSFTRLARFAASGRSSAPADRPPAAKSALGLLGMLILAASSSCSSAELSANPPERSLARFENDGVYTVLLRDCGYPACHGSNRRLFQVFGPGRSRLTEWQVFEPDGVTPYCGLAHGGGHGGGEGGGGHGGGGHGGGEGGGHGGAAAKPCNLLPLVILDQRVRRQEEGWEIPSEASQRLMVRNAEEPGAPARALDMAFLSEAAIEPVTMLEIDESFEHARAMLAASENPNASPLVRKPLSVFVGGAPHGGVDRFGADIYLSVQDPDWETIARWAAGE